VITLFVVSRYLIKDILLMLSSSSHNLISLLVIYGSASHHLFGLTQRSFYDDFEELNFKCNYMRAQNLQMLIKLASFPADSCSIL
jgi:hypothetical protein